MKTIIKEHRVPQFTSKQLKDYFRDMRVGVFDIETLGLKPDICSMVLAGFMTVNEDGCCILKQYFAETPEDEKLILEQLKLDFANVDYLFTYNGKHFDIPFVLKRANKWDILDFDASLYNLDLYLILNGHSEVKYLLENLKQKTVEEYMGLSTKRDDLISGAESIKLYNAYSTAINQEIKIKLENKILLHNHDDLLQLYQLLPILKQVNIHKAFYHLGFPILRKNGWPTLNITSLKVSNLGLSINGKYVGNKFSYISYDSFDKHFFCEFKEDGTFNFNLHTDKHKGNIFINLPLFFKNYDDFKKYPNCIKNFLLVSNNNIVSHMEVNAFTKKFISDFMDNTICPLSIL